MLVSLPFEKLCSFIAYNLRMKRSIVISSYLKNRTNVVSKTLFSKKRHETQVKNLEVFKKRK